jgi:hypothetical protein
MGNISEKTNRCGRPEKIRVNSKGSITDFVEWERMDYNKTDRTKMNEYYARVAQVALDYGDSDEFSFIISAVNATKPVFDTYKKTILIELGRLEDVDLIRKVASMICEKELTTTEAVAQIRQLRVGSKPKGSVYNLAKALAKSIDEYKSKHSDVTDEMVQESLNIICISNNLQK